MVFEVPLGTRVSVYCIVYLRMGSGDRSCYIFGSGVWVRACVPLMARL